MTKTKFVFIAMALALFAWAGASVASAQDGPTVTADPAYVDAPGEHEFTLTGAGFTAASVNATSCPADEEVTPDNFLRLCGLGSAATSTGDGGFTATITATVGEAGVSLQMVELRQGGENASVLVTVGAPEMDDDMHDAGAHRGRRGARRCDGARPEPQAAYPIAPPTDQYSRCPGPSGLGHRSL